MSDTITFKLPDEPATLALGARLAAALFPGLTIHLLGDLGAGKTTFTRGVLRALGHSGAVKSPTYTLVECYELDAPQGVLTLYHFDCYRFVSPDEFLEAGLEEYFGTPAICLVEWPDKAAPFLPEPDLRLHLCILPDGREALFEPVTEAGHQCLSRLAFSPWTPNT